jgi:anti-sigma factor ChrR (cupin superfamily)
MITEQQQERASLYALGALTTSEQPAFEKELRVNAELRELVMELQRTTNLMAQTEPQAKLPQSLKEKVLKRIEQTQAEVGRVTPCAPLSDVSGAQRTARPTAATALAGLRFLDAAAESGWKQLPVPGAFIKLLSLERERGYAVLLGKIEPGVRYPAHVNAGPEDFYILSGDLVVGDRKLRAGDFHHADSGSKHEVNYSVEGCTLLAVLTTDDPLVAFAMA